MTVKNIAACKEIRDAIRGIRRGLDEMKAGKGEPASKVFERIRAKHNIPRWRR